MRELGAGSEAGSLHRGLPELHLRGPAGGTGGTGKAPGGHRGGTGGRDAALNPRGGAELSSPDHSGADPGDTHRHPQVPIGSPLPPAAPRGAAAGAVRGRVPAVPLVLQQPDFPEVMLRAAANGRRDRPWPGR